MRFLEVIYYGLSYRMFFENLLKSSWNRRLVSPALLTLVIEERLDGSSWEPFLKSDFNFAILQASGIPTE